MEDLVRLLVPFGTEFIKAQMQAVHAVEEPQTQDIPVGQVVGQTEIEIPESVISPDLLALLAVHMVVVSEARNGDGLHPGTPEAEIE